MFVCFENSLFSQYIFFVSKLGLTLDTRKFIITHTKSQKKDVTEFDDSIEKECEQFFCDSTILQTIQHSKIEISIRSD
jgi:hypothetical protein